MTDTTDFDRVFALLAVIADASGCKARLSELQKSIEALAKARAKLAADRAAHDQITPASGQSFRDLLADGQPCPTCPEMARAPVGFMLRRSALQDDTQRP
jgi:hypothetical protein